MTLFLNDTELTAFSGPRLSLANPLVKRLLAVTYPDYRGRKVELRAWVRPRQLENYWSGGTRSYWRLVRITDGAVMEPTNDNPFERAAHMEVDLPAGHLFVEHSYFCGKDMGIRIHGRVDEVKQLAAPLLGAGR